MAGAAWRRCRVHSMRNLLSRVVKAQSDAVAAMVRTIFIQPSAAAGRAGSSRRRSAASAFAVFPEAHWKKIWSTTPLEPGNREVKRSTDVVGIFLPTPALRAGSDTMTTLGTTDALTA